MNTLQKLLSKEPNNIWQACSKIAKSTDIGSLTFLAGYLEEISASVQGIDLGGAMLPNTYHLNFALRKLNYVQEKQECLCALYLNICSFPLSLSSKTKTSLSTTL